MEERLKAKDGQRNLGYCLAACEDLQERYDAQGIPTKILLDTLQDIRIWTENISVPPNELALEKLCWLKEHLSMRLFKIGRLQFQFSTTEKGMPSLAVHIPSGGPLFPAACKRSYTQAATFFARYYPGLFVCLLYLPFLVG